MKTPIEFILPLLGETAWTDDKAPLQVATNDQLFDEQSGHDGLSRTGVVGEQKSQRLAKQHLAIHRGDLVRQRLDNGSMDREHGIEKVGQPDALGLGGEPEQMPIAIEAP